MEYRIFPKEEWSNSIFLQVNALPCTSKLNKKWLQNKSIKFMFWPLQISDCIEYVISSWIHCSYTYCKDDQTMASEQVHQAYTLAWSESRFDPCRELIGLTLNTLELPTLQRWPNVTWEQVRQAQALACSV